ncbi:MAG: GTP-binding protein engB [Firmicutes bacterium]|nr:GTP-binding protein engB [Bacillota bacterium]
MTINVLYARYMASAVRVDQYPEGDMPEIAFIGRSNVGKSSLINSLCRHGGLARISGTPGKTQTLNFYSVAVKLDETERQEFWLVDLPGYGYARTGRGNRRQWSKFIDEYLSGSDRLALVCQLIDIRHSPMASDIEAYNNLRELGVPVLILCTKADKISRMAVKKNVGIIRNQLKLLPEQEPLIYSAVNGSGRNELLDVIKHILLK